MRYFLFFLFFGVSVPWRMSGRDRINDGKQFPDDSFCILDSCTASRDALLFTFREDVSEVSPKTAHL